VTEAGADTGTNEQPSAEGESASRPPRGPRHPRGDRGDKFARGPRNKGGNGDRGDRANHPSRHQEPKASPTSEESQALFASVVSGEFDATLDTPEVETEVTHDMVAQTLAELETESHSSESETKEAQAEEDLMPGLHFSNVDPAICFGYTNAFAEQANTFRSKTTTSDPYQGWHARIIPAIHAFFFN
jgi:23S rRNA pseudouridine2605 synthase